MNVVKPIRTFASSLVMVIVVAIFTVGSFPRVTHAIVPSTMCPDDVLISNYQTTPSGEQFIDVSNVGGSTINIDDCSLVTFNSSENSIGAATVGLSGCLASGETIRVTFTGQLPAGPAAVSIMDVTPPPPDGTPFGALQSSNITGMTYIDNNTIFGIAHIRVPANNSLYACIYGGFGTGPFTRPFTPFEECFEVPPPTCSDDVLISNYQTTPTDQQFVDIANVGSSPIKLDQCSLVTFNAFTETSIGAATVGLSGCLASGETTSVDFAGELPAGPGAIGIYDAPPPSDGTPFSTNNEITGMVYLNNDMVFGISHLQVPSHNEIYECIYGGSGQGPFTGPFLPFGDCFP